MIQRLVLLCCLALCCVGCKPTASVVEPAQPTDPLAVPAELTPLEAKVFRTNLDEQLVLALGPQLNLWAKRLKGGKQPSDLFADDFEGMGLDAFDIKKEVRQPDKLVAHVSPPLSNQPSNADSLWAPVLDHANFLDAKFGVESGKLDHETKLFNMKAVFEGRFELDGQVCGAKAKQSIVWQQVGDQWRIAKWKQDKFEIIASTKTLFENVTEKVIGDPATRKVLRESAHEAMLLRRANDAQLMAHYDPVFSYYSDWTSLFQYTSASVVDLDRDGWDDVFISARIGESVLLRNKGDGTFEDVSKTCGLKLEQVMTNSTVFADFDNDGDSDCLLGRSLQGCLYFRNDDGNFVPDAEVNKELSLVRMVSSVSVADVNADGLLDVYFSTYATRSGTDVNWVQYAVPPYQQNILYAKISQSHPFVDRCGPPNIMFLNRAGKLSPADIKGPIQQWRNSFQSVWSDIDNDGDQDCYICNDFAPDVLLKNETKPGSYRPLFVEATHQCFEEDTMGFGMGASFGDYNSDGKLDLYISNMYSKAGRRVIDQFDGEVDPRVAISAQGNFLYENLGDGNYRHVAGLEPGKQQVSKVGWSFGGQFADFNNDGKLDLYVPSGFFTAPDSIADEVDL